MAWIRALVPVLLAGCTAIAALPALAQSTTSTPVKRQKVDVRAMVPGAQASEPSSDSRPAAGLTRDQRKEATLQARQDGSLLPAGDAAEPREPKPLAAGSDGVRPALNVEAAPARPIETTTEVAANTPAAAKVATATPSPSASKKSRKKQQSRGASAPTPI